MTNTITLDTPMAGDDDLDDGATRAVFRGGAYDDATVDAFIQAIHDTHPVFGLRTPIITGQIAHETARFRFGGDVSPDQYNLAGLGATGGGAAGLTYPDIRTGAFAVCAHHMTYLYGDLTNWPATAQQYQSLDQRYAAVMSAGKGGTIKILGDYRNGWWAYTSSIPIGSLANHYAEDICAVANTVVGSGPPAPTPQPGGTLNIIDVRGQLPTNPGGGSGQTHFPKSGIIWHYTGPPVNMDADEMTMLISYANFHIGPYLNEAGIAYHYDIAPDGTIRLLRNPEAVLWHCGAWPFNASHYAVHFELGEGQHATAAQLASGIALGDFLRTQDGFGRDECKGHQEVSSTACPGSLMDDLVYPYRAGSDAPVSDYIFFTTTGHGYANAFRDYFQKMGGVPIIGLPLSEEMDDPAKEKINGKVMTVQYAERERLEYHPELPHDPNAPGGGQVLLTRLGALAAAAAGLTGPGIPPTLAPPIMKGAKK